MTNSNVVIQDREFDPWIYQPENNKPVPETARLVCIIKLNAGIERLNELLWFNRTQDKDELWSLTTLDDSVHRPGVSAVPLLKRGRVSASTYSGTAADSAYQLLQEYIRLRAGHAWPCGFIKSGLLDEQQFEELLKGTEQEFEKSKKMTQTGIISHPRGPKTHSWFTTVNRLDDDQAGSLSR